MTVWLDGIAALLLAALAITDWRSRRLPRSLMGLLLLVAFLRAALEAGISGLAFAGISAVIAAAPLYGLRRALPRNDPRWRLGGGDVRLAFAFGAWIGAFPALMVLAAGAGLAGLAGLGASKLHPRGDMTQPLGSWCAVILAVAWLAGRFARFF